MMRILWASDNFELYKQTFNAISLLGPDGESGCFDLGEPYYSCPIRFVYSPEGRPPKYGSCDLVLSDDPHIKLGGPVATLSEVKSRLTDPRALFDFLFFEKGKQTNNSGYSTVPALKAKRREA